MLANLRCLYALPIHDALIVPARCASHAADLMVQSFGKIVGRASPCTVKINRQNVLQMGEGLRVGVGSDPCGATHGKHARYVLRGEATVIEGDEVQA
jgi:hypothetical protein